MLECRRSARATRGGPGSRARSNLRLQPALLIQPGRRRRAWAMIQGENCVAGGGTSFRCCRSAGDDFLVGFVLGQHLADVASSERIACEQDNEDHAETSKWPNLGPSRKQELVLHD